MDPGALGEALERGEAGPAIVCAQAGEINTGAFDPFDAIADTCERHGAWLHVDGAFGLWAAAVPSLRHVVHGVSRAHSWITDAHKLLNVPYDSALVFCADPEAHRAAMTASASYLIQDGRARRDPFDWVPEFSRRARGFAVYAALRSLGRRGLSELIERTCACARRFAEGIVALAGVTLLNEVVFNQVLFCFESDAKTDSVLEDVQASGEVWMSGTSWDGRRAIRVSVSNWRTGPEQIDLALECFRAARARAPK
jgi:glutamate/tyrosine decarboxylase-like PLP-dependent enzyme